MACNTSSADAEPNTAEQPGNDENSQIHEPWEESDLILVVENEKFHVHRQTLSMNSPVFKAMFKSEFREATSSEIPLPEKKAKEVLDFLKQFYIQEREKVTMENVEHLLRLSDEYQVKPIFDRCVKFLGKQSLDEGNVTKILILCSLYKLENLRQSCFNFGKHMKLQSILQGAQQEGLDSENLKSILSNRIELLENFLDKLYPVFMGMVECCFWLWFVGKKNMDWCQQHFSDGKSNLNIDKRLRKCEVCHEMLATIIHNTTTQEYSYWKKSYVTSRTYGGSLHFSDSLPEVIEEFSTLTKRK